MTEALDYALVTCVITSFVGVLGIRSWASKRAGSALHSSLAYPPRHLNSLRSLHPLRSAHSPLRRVGRNNFAWIIKSRRKLPLQNSVSDWITSPSFNECARSAIKATEIVLGILKNNPELSLMPCLFGIYLFHGSLIPLPFADRMSSVHGEPKESVEGAREVIIRAHEACIVTLNTEFQRVFRKVMRIILLLVQAQARGLRSESTQGRGQQDPPATWVAGGPSTSILQALARLLRCSRFATNCLDSRDEIAGEKVQLYRLPEVDIPEPRDIPCQPVEFFWSSALRKT